MKVNLVIAAFAAIIVFVLVAPAGILSAVVFFGILSIGGIAIRYLVKGIGAAVGSIRKITRRPRRTQVITPDLNDGPLTKISADEIGFNLDLEVSDQASV